MHLPSATLKQLVKLSERKETLMAQIQSLDREMVRLQSKFGAPTQTPGLRGSVTISQSSGDSRGKPRAKRGALKEKIVRALRVAGKKGVTIRELSAKLGVRSANLYVWFNGTGRNVRGMKKIGVAKYRLS